MSTCISGLKMDDGAILDILVDLLAKGAHPGICNNMPETPIYVASENGHYGAA